MRKQFQCLILALILENKRNIVTSKKNRLAKLSKKYSLLEYCIVLHNLKILCTCLIVFVSSKHLLGQVWQVLSFITLDKRWNFFKNCLCTFLNNSVFIAIILDVCNTLNFTAYVIPYLSLEHLQAMKSKTHGHSGRVRLCLPLPVHVQTLKAPALKCAECVSLWKSFSRDNSGVVL